MSIIEPETEEAPQQPERQKVINVADVERRFGLILGAVDARNRKLRVDRNEPDLLEADTRSRAVNVGPKLLANLPEGPFNPFVADRELLARVIVAGNQSTSQDSRDYTPRFGIKRAIIADRNATADHMLGIVNDTLPEGLVAQPGSLLPIAVNVQAELAEQAALDTAMQGVIDRLQAEADAADAWVPDPNDPTAVAPEKPNVPTMNQLSGAVKTVQQGYDMKEGQRGGIGWHEAARRLIELEHIPPPPPDSGDGDGDGEGGGGGGEGGNGGGYQPSFAESLKELSARADAQDRRDDDEVGGGIFGGDTGNSIHVRGWVPPSADAKNLAARLRRALDRARWPEPTVTIRPFALPPGKLRHRSALQADARRAAGDPTMANDLFERRRRRIDEPNDLSVGMCVDVSSSMDSLARVSADWGYAFSNAAYRAGARFAATTWGTTTQPLCAAGSTLTKVPVLNCAEGTTDLVKAMRAVMGQLDLTRPGRARVLIVSSDGQVSGSEQESIAHHSLRLKRAGCRLVQIHLSRNGHAVQLEHFEMIDARSNEELCARLEQLMVRLTVATPTAQS